MRGLLCEEDSFGPTPSLKDVVRHLYTRMWCGTVVIAVAAPNVVLPALRKQWLKLARKVQGQCANTQDAARIRELSATISQMHRLRFTTDWPGDDLPAAVHVVCVEQLVEWAPDCRTIYIACRISKESLHVITALMPEGSLVVMCPLAP